MITTWMMICLGSLLIIFSLFVAIIFWLPRNRNEKTFLHFSYNSLFFIIYPTSFGINLLISSLPKIGIIMNELVIVGCLVISGIFQVALGGGLFFYARLISETDGNSTYKNWIHKWGLPLSVLVHGSMMIIRGIIMK